MTKMMCTSNTSRPATRFHTIVTARRKVAYPTMTNGYRLGFTLPPLPNLNRNAISHAVDHALCRPRSTALSFGMQDAQV